MREKIYLGIRLGYENWKMHIMYSLVLNMLYLKRDYASDTSRANMHNNLPFPVSVTGSNRW
jgi:hypothetical protein